ncbi:radical SAM protein [Streptomyces zhihengii]
MQFIGGEPTRSITLLPLITHALGREFKVEVCSNLTHVRLSQWAAFEQHGVRLATGYCGDDPAEHDLITGVAGSHARTRANIVRALERRVPLRVGVVQLEDTQRVDAAVAELQELGVTNIRVGRIRAVGQAAASARFPGAGELCGRCFHHRLAIAPDGDLYGASFRIPVSCTPDDMSHGLYVDGRSQEPSCGSVGRSVVDREPELVPEGASGCGRLQSSPQRGPGDQWRSPAGR